MKRNIFLMLCVVLAMILAACAPEMAQPSPTPAPTETPAQSGPIIVTSPTPLPSTTPAGSPAGGKDLPNSPAALAALKALAEQLGVSTSQIKVVKVEAVEWPNGCLGVQRPGIMCTMMVTPGFRVVLDANGQTYEFHTNQDGSAVVLAGQQMPQTADKVLVWELTEGATCSRIEIGAQGAAYGPCAGPLKEVKLEPARGAELTYLLATYQSFSGGTKAGTVSFNGQGQKQPTPAEMRSVAEWARLVNLEAQGGRSGAAWGVALAWHREGGIAGFCDDLSVYVTGWAAPTSCKSSQPKAYNNYRLTADELAKLYTWIDQYKNFEYGQKDQAVADSMKVTLIFTGSGTQTPTPEQQAAVAEWAAEIDTRAVQ